MNMRKFNYLFSIMAIAALLAIASVGCSAEAKKAQHIKQADKYFAEGEYDKAEIEYINVLRSDRENIPAIIRLGTINLEQGRIGRAAPVLLRGRQLATNNLELRLKSGLVFLAFGKFNEARAEASFVLDRNPQDNEAPLLLAEIAFNQKEIEDARQRMKALIQKGDRASLQVALGALSFRQSDFQTAETAFKRAQSLDPKFAATYSALGALYLAQNKTNQAEPALKTAADLSPPRSPRRLQYAQYKIRSGDLAAGKKLLEEMVKKTPDYIPALMGLAELAVMEGKYDDSANLLNKVMTRDPDNYEAILLSGQAKLQKGDFASAKTELERMVNISTTNTTARVHYYLALAYLGGNEDAKAVGSLNKATTLQADFPEAILALAQLQMKNEDFTPAIASLKQLIQKHPEVPQAWLLLAGAYRDQGAKGNLESLNEALKLYQQLEKTFPRNPELPLLIGATFLQQKNPDEARKAFTRSFDMAPDNLPALEQLVNLDLMERKYSAASQRVQQQVQKTPKLAVPQLFLARIYLAQQDRNKAEAALLKAIELQPDSQAAHLMLAQLYMESKQNQKALANLKIAVTKNPKDVGSLMTIGMINEQEKDFKAARDAYEKLLAIDPKFSAALNNLAFLYSETFDQPDKAYEMARRARDLLPNDPATADTLGWVQFKKKQYAAAVSLLQESADKLPAEPEVQYHLGMARYMMGAEDSARIAFQRALQSTNAFRGKEESSQHLSLLAIDVKTAGAGARAILEKKFAERPDDPIALDRLIAIYQRDGAVDKAIETYEAALKATPKNIKVIVPLARLYSSRPQKTQEALELAKAAYKLTPEDPEVSHMLGRLAYATQDYKLASSVLQETSQKRPKDPELLYELSNAYYSLGKIADSEAAMKSALQTGAPFSRANEAKRFLDMTALAGNPSQALAAVARVEEILKSDSNYVPALMVMAAVNEQKASLPAATQTYEKVLVRYPDFVPAKKSLAILYSADPGNDKKVYELAMKARESYPEDAELAKALGIIIYRQGDFTRSAKLLSESAGKRTGDADLMYYLGMARYRLKDRTGSKTALQRALDLNLSGKFATEAKRVLAELK